jgi:hypothetical protein
MVKFWVGDKEYGEDDDIPEPPAATQKQCKKCGLYKPYSEFFKRGKASKYHHAYCKSCHSQPYDYEKIVCPHCKEKIAFVGIDFSGAVVNKDSTILRKLKKQVKNETKRKYVKKKTELPTEEPKNIKDLL